QFTSSFPLIALDQKLLNSLATAGQPGHNGSYRYTADMRDFLGSRRESRAKTVPVLCSLATPRHLERVNPYRTIPPAALFSARRLGPQGTMTQPTGALAGLTVVGPGTEKLRRPVARPRHSLHCPNQHHISARFRAGLPGNKFAAVSVLLADSSRCL